MVAVWCLDTNPATLPYSKCGSRAAGIPCRNQNNTVDKLVQRANASILIGTSSWKEQFVEAITVSAGDDDGENEGEEPPTPSCMDYIMHFVTLFWKIIFAFIPPTGKCFVYDCYA
uniref:Uncharacterized protein n=1 Tax=Anopheles culicifacies TaxID=139723 RepID=A0A182MSA0_9DIPT